MPPLTCCELNVKRGFLAVKENSKRRKQLQTSFTNTDSHKCALTVGFPGGSDGKESAHNAETQVWSLGKVDPLEKGMATHSQYSCLEHAMDRGLSYSPTTTSYNWVKFVMLRKRKCFQVPTSSREVRRWIVFTLHGLLTSISQNRRKLYSWKTLG